MSVSHCPICPLIFQFRTEVEYHLRNDHRSRADEALDLRDELQEAQGDLTWLRLQGSGHRGPDFALKITL